ncbi:MAG: hypothetical protein IPK16_18690 [Anaerolineales bacterium]|nr:hypothetical protein [Anaerolineales bacterium]
MIRKLMVPVFAALAMVMVMGTTAFAADATVAQPSGCRAVRRFCRCRR